METRNTIIDPVVPGYCWTAQWAQSFINSAAFIIDDLNAGRIHDQTKTFRENDIVGFSDGTTFFLYSAIQDVPINVSISDSQYWRVIMAGPDPAQGHTQGAIPYWDTATGGFLSSSAIFANNSINTPGLVIAGSSAPELMGGLRVSGGNIDFYTGSLWQRLNLTIAPSSEQYLDYNPATGILEFSSLPLTGVIVDDTVTSLNDFITSFDYPTNSIDTGRLVALTNTSPSVETYIHNGGNAGDTTDFTLLGGNLNDGAIKALFSAGTQLDYNSSTGVIRVDPLYNVPLLGTTVGQTLYWDTTQWTFTDSLLVNGDIISFSHFLDIVPRGNPQPNFSTYPDGIIRAWELQMQLPGGPVMLPILQTKFSSTNWAQMTLPHGNTDGGLLIYDSNTFTWNLTNKIFLSSDTPDARLAFTTGAVNFNGIPATPLNGDVSFNGTNFVGRKDGAWVNLDEQGVAVGVTGYQQISGTQVDATTVAYNCNDSTSRFGFDASSLTNKRIYLPEPDTSDYIDGQLIHLKIPFSFSLIRVNTGTSSNPSNFVRRFNGSTPNAVAGLEININLDGIASPTPRLVTFKREGSVWIYLGITLITL